MKAEGERTAQQTGGCGLPELQAQHIDAASGLDSIDVYWHNLAPHKGMVTVVCYGQAWTAYFGAMPEATIQEFYATATDDYLTNALMRGEMLKRANGHRQYLARIVTSVKVALAAYRAGGESR